MSEQQTDVLGEDAEVEVKGTVEQNAAAQSEKPGKPAQSEKAAKPKKREKPEKPEKPRKHRLRAFAGRLRGAPRWARVGYAVISSILLVALLGGTAYLAWDYHNTQEAEQARTDASNAAAAEARAMFSYDFKSVDKQMAAASNGLTDSFKKTFDDLVHKTVIPAAKEKDITVKATVVGQAPLSASKDSATVLLFVNQIANSNTGPKASFTPSRVEMSMKKVDGRWLVDKVETI